MAITELNKFNWIFYDRISVESAELKELYLADEKPIIAYKTTRDAVIFTDKRIIIRDKQGITGKKIETYTIPYRSIDMFSIENAGLIDLTSEVELWCKFGHVKLNFKKDFDLILINNLLSQSIL